MDKLTEREQFLLRLAVSYALANREDVNEAFRLGGVLGCGGLLGRPVAEGEFDFLAMALGFTGV